MHLSNQPTTNRLRRGLAVLFAIGVVATIWAIVGALGSYLFFRADFVSPGEVGVNQPSNGAKILDRNGVLIYQYLDDRQGLRVPVDLGQVADAMLAATIATEDASFYTNSGINTRGLARALWENFNPLSGDFLDGSGGSSITQQLIKNLYIPEGERSARSPTRKVREAVYAIELTQRYDKDQILEWYLNQISYGGIFNGIESASSGYFSKPASQLTLAEAALLAGIPQSPAAYSPIIDPQSAIARRNQVLDLIASHGRIQIGPDRYYVPDAAEIEAAKGAPLALAQQRFPIEAPHFVLTYLQPELEARFGRDALYRDGLVVTTTLDLALQRKANEVLETQISQFEESSNTHNGSVVVMDPRTGEVLAMVGSRDYFRDDIQGQNNNAIALNSPGSTFKPFVYLDAFVKLGWAPGTGIEDTPVTFRNPDGSVFQPRNPNGGYSGTVTVRNALGNSLNVPAFKAAAAVGVPDVVTLARKMGFTTLDGSYGPAIATGGVDLTQIDLVYGYSVLANGGIMRGQKPVEAPATGARELEPVSVLKVQNGKGSVIYEAASQRAEKRIVGAEQAFFVNSILSDPSAQCLTFGCGGLSVPGRTMAIKTGTSEPFAAGTPNAGKIGETWAFGYTPDVVVGVWAGNSDNSPITNISSSSLAFRAMRDVAVAYYNGRASTPFTQPQGVVRSNVCVTASSSGGCASIVSDFVLRSALDTPAVRNAVPTPRPPVDNAPGTGRPVPTVVPTQTSRDDDDDDDDRPPRQRGRDNRPTGRGSSDDDDE